MVGPISYGGLNATMAANPIGLIITAMVFGSGFHLPLTTEGFREFGSISGKVKVAITVWNAIKISLCPYGGYQRNLYTVVTAIRNFCPPPGGY